MKQHNAPTFNPFDKDIHKVRVTDLQKLVENRATEGWYLQYLPSFPDDDTLGRAVASFANSDGGWIVIGVQAGDDRTARKITGFDRNVAHRPNEKARDLILHQVTPVPPFESRLIKYSDKAEVLVIYVERGDEAPYLTHTGTIYRRDNSASQPVPENDRYAIAKLYERSGEVDESIEAFSHNPFANPGPHCQLEGYVYTQPINKYRLEGFMNRAFIKALRKRFASVAETLPGYLDFDNFSTSHGSYILRLTPAPKDYTSMSVVLELFHNGNLKVFIPLEGMPIPATEEDLYQVKKQFKHLEPFQDQVGRPQMAQLRVIDGYKILVTFTVLLEQYLGLLRQKGYVNPLKLRFRLTNARNTLLFFDNKGYLAYLSEYGPPICFKDQVEIPHFGRGNAFEVPIAESPMVFIGLLFGALGLPPAFLPNAMKGLERYVNDLKVRSKMAAKVLGLFDEI